MPVHYIWGRNLLVHRLMPTTFGHSNIRLSVCIMRGNGRFIIQELHMILQQKNMQGLLIGH